MSFVIDFIVKNGHVLSAVYFIFLKQRIKSSLKGFQLKRKYQESGYQVRQVLMLCQISCSRFRLKRFQRSSSYKSCQTDYI